MSLFPALLDLRGRLCLVFGGGTVACRKLGPLLSAGARVRLVAPHCVCPPENEEFEWLRRGYRRQDLVREAALVVVATDDERLNREISDAARSLHIMVNATSCGAVGDLQFPAQRRRGKLCFAVATEGESPALAAIAADRAMEFFGPEWEFIVELAGSLRRRALTACNGQEYNQSILRLLLEGGLAGMVAQGRWNDLDQLLQKVCGTGCSLAGLGLERPDGKP